MKKILLILLILPLGLFAQDYKVLYVDTIQQGYVISDTLMGEGYVIEHIYGYDTVQLLKDISDLELRFEQITQKKADRIVSYNRELLIAYREKKRLTRILNKIRTQ